MEDLAGKVAVVTGAASGIGFALSERLAAEGMRLVLADIERAALDAATATLAERAEVFPVVCDVSVFDQVAAVADAAVDRFGALHLAVNNAGVAGGGLSWGIDLAEWEWILGVNLWGVIHGITTFTPRIIESGGGHIVNTASMAGLTSPPFMGPYNVTKHAVVTLSETLYHELGMFHPEVGVTVVCPGWVRTRIASSNRNRPGGPPPEDPSHPLAAAKGTFDALIETGIEPAEVADLVVDAVRNRRFYVLTHPAWTESVVRRHELITSGQNPEMSLPVGDGGEAFDVTGGS